MLNSNIFSNNSYCTHSLYLDIFFENKNENN